MKKDLLTTIGVAVIGTLISFVVCNFLFGNIEGASFMVLNEQISSDVESPDPEVFNYRSLNPTVEVYVGDCREYSENGECLDNDSGIINIEETGTVQEKN